MASSETDTAAWRDPREQILSAVRKGHSVTLDAFKVVVDRAAPVTSKIPAAKLPSARFPAVNVPSPDLAGAREFVLPGYSAVSAASRALMAGESLIDTR